MRALFQKFALKFKLSLKFAMDSGLKSCCFKFIFRRYAIRAGDHNLAKLERSEQEIIPEQIFVHENFQNDVFVNAIALVKLRQEVKLGKFVRTVCLPKKEEGDLAIPTKYGIATGWGATKPLKPGEIAKKADQHPRILQYSSFRIQQDQLCSNKSVIAINSTVSFCAGDGKGGNDTCYGDSGGAFVREAKRGHEYRWVATGLVSWGNGCAQKDEYTYYTRVYPFIDWIKKNMDEN